MSRSAGGRAGKGARAGVRGAEGRARLGAVDPLSADSRAERLASWGPTPAGAVRLAHRLRDRFHRVTETEPVQLRPRTAPPTIDGSRLAGADIDALARLAPVRTDDDARRAFSLGKSWPDLMAARSDRLERVMDAVVRPRTEEELERAIAWCAEADVCVIPVGGGTTVAGGIEPIGRTASQPVVAMDVSGLSTCLDVDATSGVATFQAGIRGPELERALSIFGLTMGHIPQSFEYSTLGGWIATRSAGQQSLRYGKIEAMTAAMRVATPAGPLDIPHLPAHGAGPDLRELLLGSEGTFGVISRATVRVRPRPERVRFVSYLFLSFQAAADAARTLAQGSIARPAMVRVSDAQETAFNVGSSIPNALGGNIGRSFVRIVGAGQGSMVFVLLTGTTAETRAQEIAVDRHMYRAGARPAGPVPARTWFHGRFRQPYARDVMMDHGLLVDTLETSVSWTELPLLHVAVRRALEDTFGNDRCVVGCHLSHLYHDGASAYFTFIAQPPEGRELEQWRRAKRAVHEAIAANGGSASHQHGVGTMHTDLYARTVPQLGVDTWRAVRTWLDPSGLMNPGKLFDRPSDGQLAINSVAPRQGGAARDGITGPA